MKLGDFRKVLPVLLALAACTSEPATETPVVDDMFPLQGGGLYDDAPSNDVLPEEGKADQVIPAQYNLVSAQSPVQSQGRRGVCSIFSTTAHMEHLYIVEGSLPNPDFSEQFLQWSSKVELGMYTDGEGSSADANIRALYNFGGVLEQAWPYESLPWNEANDAACVGDEENRPVRCFTNGNPPESALTARRFHLPAPRWINSTPRSLKSHMLNTGTGAEVGGTFFYQAWNHGASKLPLHREYRARGIVPMPNQEDITSSLMDRAGHSILLVGWDDNMEVQSVDKDGNLVVDAAGNPVMQRGFFLFKNSWGTTWATENEFGPGYGWISYEYVSQYLRGTISAVPEVHLSEICGNGIDDDVDEMTDCADSDCASERSCLDPADSFAGTGGSIPDNNAAGFTSTIQVTSAGNVTGASVAINIEHTYIGDLTVTLRKGDRTATLFEREGAGTDNLVRTFDVPQFAGEVAAGAWSLTIVDSAGQDVGRLVSWTLQLTRCEGSACNMAPRTISAQTDTLVVIPDNDARGQSSDLELTGTGRIQALRITVAVEHPQTSDLHLSLMKTGAERPIVLVSGEIGIGTRTFTVADFNGQDAAGTYRLNVIDSVAGNEGTINSWSLEAVVE